MSNPIMNTTTEAANDLKRTLLESAGDESGFTELLKQLSPKQLKETQEFFWDFVLTQSESTQTPIGRNDIISAIEPASKFQQRARCKEPIGYCTVSMCIRTNPECAVNRLTSVMRSLRPMLASILSERPELLSMPLETPVVSENGSESTLSESPAEDKTLSTQEPESLSHAEVSASQEPLASIEASDDKYAKYKPTLWSMIEFDGLDHSILMTTEGRILQFASAAKTDINKIAQVLSAEILAVIEQGEAANFKPLLTVTKEFKKGVVAMRSLGNDIYLVGVSETVLPAKIHSLIVRLGNQLKEELEAEKPEA